MMKKFLFFIPIFLLLNIFAHAQLQHSISLNGKLYGNFFNNEKERLGSYTYELWDTWLPRLNYKVSKGKHGLEFYFSHSSSYYNDWSPVWLNGDSQIIRIIQFGCGINYHYKYWERSYLSLGAFAGVNYSFYDELLDYGRVRTTESRGGGEFGYLYGFQLGQNIQAPIWRGLFANMTARYTYNVFTDYDNFKQNLIVEFGLGYSWPRKKGGK